MDQPIDFSKKVYKKEISKPIYNSHQNHSENSDENTRSSSSSPDNNFVDQQSLSSDALLMLAAVNQNLALNHLIQPTISSAPSPLPLISSIDTNTLNNQISTSFNQLTPSHLIPSTSTGITNSQFLSSFTLPLINSTTNSFNQNTKSKLKNSAKTTPIKARSKKSMIMAKANQTIENLALTFNTSANEPMITPETSMDSTDSKLMTNKKVSYALANSRRRRGQPIPDHLKDEGYWVRRRKNNEAAKKSRDAKRAKDLLVAKKALYLETENAHLRNEISEVKNENLILRTFLTEEAYTGSAKKNLNEILSLSQKMNKKPDQNTLSYTQIQKQFTLKDYQDYLDRLGEDEDEDDEILNESSLSKQ